MEVSQTVEGVARKQSASGLDLGNGSRVGVIGGGPAGSLFSYFFLKMTKRFGLDIEVDLYEPRDFSCPGPKGCNMCGGIISESLVQNLAAEGIHLPPEVIQRRIDSYFLHMDVGSVRIETPLEELRIAAVARGAGPRGSPNKIEGFDGFLLDLAIQEGARRIEERVASADVSEPWPRIRTSTGKEEVYDLVVGAVGVNTSLLKAFEGLKGYSPPRRTKAYVAEFPLGAAMIERYLANSMHVFLLNLSRLDFAALIPKSDFVTVCLLGQEIDKTLFDAFIGSDQVKEVLPPHWQVPSDFCHCSPHMNVGSAIVPYRDRMVFVGDCGTTRLFKDGIGAAYRTAKAAARTAVLRGVGAEDFRRGFWPTCKSIDDDNRLGRVVFRITREIQSRKFARRGLWRMTTREQWLDRGKRRMSRVLWDTFTGSAPYKSVMLRSLHPAVLSRLAWESLGGRSSHVLSPAKPNVVMASGRTGETAKFYREGVEVYRQGEQGDSMYIVCSGKAEMSRREDERTYSLPRLEEDDFFGEMAVFHEGVRPVTVRALEELCLVELHRDGLMLRVHEDPSMAYRLIERMSSRIASLEDAMKSCRDLPSGPWELTEGASVTDQNVDLPVGLMGREFHQGEVVYRQGDPGCSMHLIRGGKVEVVFREGEEEYHLPTLGDGDFFGELALFGAEVRTKTVRALTDVYVYTVERNGLLRQIHEDASMAFQLIEKMAARISALEAALVRYGAPTSPIDVEETTVTT